MVSWSMSLRRFLLAALATVAAGEVRAAGPCTATSPPEGSVAAAFVPTQYTAGSNLRVSVEAHQYTWGTQLALTNAFPAGWQVAAGSVSPTGTVSGSTVVWSLPLGNGLCETYSFTVVAPPSATGNAKFNASFTFSSDSNSQAGTLSSSVGPAPCTAPGMPNLTSPGNGQVLAAGTTSATLAWTAALRTTSYDVSFGTSASPPFYKTTTATSVTVPVASGTTYHFKVTAKDACGSTTTPTSSFSVAACAGPGAPSLAAPANGATVTASSVTLSWGAVSGTTAYDVYLGAASPPPLLQSVTATQATVQVTAGTTYHWKVAARNACGSSNSGLRSFTTPAAPVTSSDLHVVGAAHASGIGGTSWRTDLEVCNRATTQGAFTVALLVRDQPNPAPAVRTYTLGGGSCVRYVDALASLFGFTGAASLRVTPQKGAILATSRTYTQAGSSSFGGFAVAQGQASAVTPGHDGLLVQLGQSATRTSGFRTNLALENLTASPLVASVDLYASTGQHLGTHDVTLAGFEATQLVEVFKLATTAAVPDGFAVVRTATPGGAVLAEASVIDNVSGDVAVVQPLGPDAAVTPAP